MENDHPPFTAGQGRDDADLDRHLAHLMAGAFVAAGLVLVGVIAAVVA